MSLLSDLSQKKIITKIVFTIALIIGISLIPLVSLRAAEVEDTEFESVELCEEGNEQCREEYRELEEESTDEAAQDDVEQVEQVSDSEQSAAATVNSVIPEECLEEGAAAKKICQGYIAPAAVPETGPGSVAAGIVGISILGYGARQWMASRRAMHEAMDNLYKKE